MSRWHAVLVFIAALLFSSVAQVAPTSLAQDAAPGNLGVWHDSRPSDAPLRGNGVVHRPNGDMPDFERTWIVVIQGTEQAPGICSYELGFSESAAEAKPKIFLMTAVDPSTCKVEFTVGIPTKAEPVDRNGMEYETSEDGPGSDRAAAANAPESHWLGFLHPDALAALSERSTDAPLLQVEAEGGIQLRYTVYGEWTDFLPSPGLVVNQVLSAVKAKVDNHNQLFDYNCRHDRSWRGGTGWSNNSSGDWGYENCNMGTYGIKSSPSGRFKNDEFPACRIAGPAKVYYDRLSARATTGDSGSPSDWTFYYGIVSTWADGGGCENLLHWAGFHTYPFEYNSLDPL